MGKKATPPPPASTRGSGGIAQAATSKRVAKKKEPYSGGEEDQSLPVKKVPGKKKLKPASNLSGPKQRVGPLSKKVRAPSQSAERSAGAQAASSAVAIDSVRPPEGYDFSSASFEHMLKNPTLSDSRGDYKQQILWYKQAAQPKTFKGLYAAYVKEKDGTDVRDDGRCKSCGTLPKHDSCCESCTVFWLKTKEDKEINSANWTRAELNLLLRAAEEYVEDQKTKPFQVKPGGTVNNLSMTGENGVVARFRVLKKEYNENVVKPEFKGQEHLGYQSKPIGKERSDESIVSRYTGDDYWTEQSCPSGLSDPGEEYLNDKPLDLYVQWYRRTRLRKMHSDQAPLLTDMKRKSPPALGTSSAKQEVWISSSSGSNASTSSGSNASRQGGSSTSKGGGSSANKPSGSGASSAASSASSAASSASSAGGLSSNKARAEHGIDNQDTSRMAMNLLQKGYGSSSVGGSSSNSEAGTSKAQAEVLQAGFATLSVMLQDHEVDLSKETDPAKVAKIKDTIERLKEKKNELREKALQMEF